MNTISVRELSRDAFAPYGTFADLLHPEKASGALSPGGGFFREPAGTFLALRPGVWHYEPFPVAQQLVTVLIVLPERAYAFDGHSVELLPEKQLRIAL